MARTTGSKKMKPGLLWLAGALAGAALTILFGSGGIAGHARGLLRAHPLPNGAAQLVSVEPFPEMDGEQCTWMPASAPTASAAAYWQSPGGAKPGDPAP